MENWTGELENAETGCHLQHAVNLIRKRSKVWPIGLIIASGYLLDTIYFALHWITPLSAYLHYYGCLIAWLPSSTYLHENVACDNQGLDK